jgi:hypothetical protein
VLKDAAFDLVHAVDTFLYVVRPRLAERHMRDIAQVLRPEQCWC